MTRRSKREIQNKLASLADGRYTEYPEASVIRILSADTFDPVEDDPNLVRCDGDLYELTPEFRRNAAKALGGAE